MKKLLLVLLLFSLTVSCSKDEDEKVDTSTFTGLYNDTVWLYENAGGGWLDKYYIRIFDNKIFSVAITTYGEDYCARDVSNPIYDGGISPLDEGLIVFDVNTTQELIYHYTVDDIDGTFSVADKWTVNDNVLEVLGYFVDGQFILNDAVFTVGGSDYDISTFQKVDLDWDESVLLIDCDDDIGA